MSTWEISAFIVCCNEEKNIRRCLESVKWCTEVVVIDSGSTDRTVDICREYTDKIFHRAWTGYVEQKRFGLEKCSCEWALNLDADEEVSGELAQEIQNVVRGDASNVNGYFLSRVVYYFGRWWRKGGWYPEYRLRLCRRSQTTWGGEDPHEKAIVNGETKRLNGELHHFTYESLSDQITRLNKFSTSAAISMNRKGKRATVRTVVFNPILRFFKFYFLKKGFLEGFAGFIIAIIEAYYVFLKYVKLWEIQHYSSNVNDE